MAVDLLKLSATTDAGWCLRQPLAVLAEAQRVVELTSAFAAHADAWPLQKRYEVAWSLPTIRLLQEVPPTRVLDLGCGYGTLAVAAYLCAHEVVAVDLFTPPPELTGIRWVCGDIQVPGAIPEGEYGVVLMTEVLEHLSVQPAMLFAEIARRVALDGCFVGSTPTPGHYGGIEPPADPYRLPTWSDAHEHPDAHVCFYPPVVLEELLTEAGLQVISMDNITDGARYLWVARHREGRREP